VSVPDWIQRIGRAALVLFGAGDSAKLAEALTVEKDRAVAEEAMCRAQREADRVRHAAVVKVLEANNAKLRELVRHSADPADVLDSLAPARPAADPKVRP
jgi:hypothetical protein